MKLKRIHVASMGLALVVLGMAWVVQTQGPQANGAVRSPSAGSWFKPGVGEGGDAALPASIQAQFETGIEHLPASLRGTEVPDGLLEDNAGNLKIIKGVRDLFDYFLSAGGEEPEAVTLARIKAYIHRHLSQKAAAQAVALLDTYVDYKNKLEVEFQKTPGQNLDDIRARMAVAKQLRAQMFARDVYDAFFAEDEALDEFGLERLATVQDSTLSATAKAQRIAELKAKLPEAQQKAMSAVEIVQTLDEVTSQLNRQGGTLQQLRTIREQLVGAEAANRLEALDQRVAMWDARVRTYLSQRDAALHNPSLSDDMKSQQITALRKDFNKSELVRIDALERIHDTGETVSVAGGGS